MVKQAAKNPDLSDVIQRLGEAFAQELPAKLDKVAHIWQQFVATHDGNKDNGKALDDDANLQKLIRLCHSLAGSAGTFGYPKLTDQARVIEGQLKTLPGTIDATTIATISDAIKLLSSCDTAAQSPAKVQAPHELNLINNNASSHNNLRLIYIVERDKKLLEEITSQLESYNYKVEFFQDLTLLHDAIKAKPPAVLILDAIMARTTTKNILASIPEDTRSQFKLITLADKPDLSTRLEAVRLGTKYFFTRPIDVTKLVDKIDIITTTSPPTPFRVLIIDDSASTAEFYGYALE